MPIAPSANTTLAKPAWVVVCRHSRDFHLGQAASLKRQFERQAGSDWDFICLTDQPSEDWHLPLRTDWPGWWGILESFRMTGQPHVLTGLDTLLYGDLRPILRLAETCPPSVLYGIRDLGKPSKWASGVTVWHGDWSFLADRFDLAEHRRRFRGNQDYTAWAVGQEPGRHLGYLQDKVDGIVSYKFGLRGKYSVPPANTRIICFHGKPRPWDVQDKEAGWVRAFLQHHNPSDPRATSYHPTLPPLELLNKLPQSLNPNPLQQMTVTTENNHPLMNAVLWDRDKEQVLAAFNGEAQTGRRMRALHPSGILELRDPVNAHDLADTLRLHGVDLSLPLDLEFLPNEPIMHGVQEIAPDLVSAAERVATPAAGGPATLPAVAALCEHRTSLGKDGVQGEENIDGHRPPVQPFHERRTSLGKNGVQGEQISDSRSAAETDEVHHRPPVQPTRLPPMFFRADGGTVDLADLYRGQTLFLVLNGSSLKDFDWDKLRRPGICSMGINNGAHGFRPQFWTCVDDPTRFMPSIWQDPCIQKFVYQGHFDKPIWDTERDVLSNLKVRDFPNVLGYRRNERFQAKQWLHEDSFNWGNHQQYGGGRSVMLVALRLAYLLGFRKVHLLGCDFQMDEQNRYWFHEDRTPSSIRNNTNSYRILTGYFEQLKPHFDHAGFQVFNANPQSQLKVFPFVTPDEALRSAEVRTSASTHGMYVDRFKAPVLPKEEYREFLEPLLAAVNTAEVATDPFVHVRLTSVFPESVYRSLLTHLPDTPHYQELRHADAIQPDGKSARLRFAFGDKEMAALPPEQRDFWQRVLQALRDPALEKAFREKLKAGLNERFRDSLSEIVLRPVPELIRDLTSYRIGAHTDIFKKVITTQFYLPEDDSQKPLGTSFYKRRSDGQFETTHRMPFLPATGYAFAVNSRSWHGVDTLPVLTKPRNSLMLTYYLGKAK
jgi:hypothetical protein